MLPNFIKKNFSVYLGAGGMNKAIRNQEAYQNGKSTYELVAGSKGAALNKERQLSSKTTRTTSLKKDLQKNTYV